MSNPIRLALDTSVVIDLFNDRLDRMSYEFIFKKSSIVFMNTIVLYELFSGARSKREISEIIWLEENFERIPIKDSHFIEAGLLNHKLKSKGCLDLKHPHKLQNDILIALICRDSKTTLITRDKKDSNLLNKYIKYNYILV